MQISLNSSEIEIIFKDEREDETFNPEKALENFLNKNLDKFLSPLIPPPLKGEPGQPGKPGESIKGDDGITPIKGIDYFTKKEVSEIKKTLKDTILSELPKILSEDEINIKFDDILKKINKLPTGGGGAMFLRQLMDVNVGTPTAQQYGLTYNPSRSEFTLSTISANGVWGTITGTLSNQTDLQSALDAKVNKSGDTMTGDLIVPDEAYGVGWNGSLQVPTKNALYDKMESVIASMYTDEQAQDAVGAMVNSTLTYVDSTPSLGINLTNANTWTGQQTFTTSPVQIGTTASGNSLNVNGTYAANSFPTLTLGNWALGTGWTFGTSPNRIIKSSDGTGNVVPTSTGYTTGDIVKITIVITNWTVGSLSYSVAGFTNQITINGNGTYIEYAIPRNGGTFVITPTNTARFTISACTAEKITNGGLIVDGYSQIRGPLTGRLNFALSTTPTAHQYAWIGVPTALGSGGDLEIYTNDRLRLNAGIIYITTPNVSWSSGINWDMTNFTHAVKATSHQLQTSSDNTIIFRGGVNENTILRPYDGTKSVIVRSAVTSPTADLLKIQTSGSVDLFTVGTAGLITNRLTTKQQQWEYDASNYANITVGSTGGVTFNAVGAGAGFTFSDPVIIATSVTVPMIVGGSGTTQTLTYKTTTGSGTTGADHIFLVGTNGATEAMRILNNGNIGIGTSSPGALLHVAGTLTVGGNSNFQNTSIDLSVVSITTDTSTGLKIGTATNQKLGFFNSAPVIQPSGNMATALSNLGLVTSPTYTITNVLTDSSITPIADGTYTISNTLGGSVTIVSGIITAWTPAT